MARIISHPKLHRFSAYDYDYDYDNDNDNDGIYVLLVPGSLPNYFHTFPRMGIDQHPLAPREADQGDLGSLGQADGGSGRG